MLLRACGWLLTGFLLGLPLSTSPAIAAGLQAGELPPFAVERSAVHRIESAPLGGTYEIFVKVPPGYGDPENADRRYPVIYLTDGHYTFQVASGVTRLPFNFKRFEPAILVGLSHALEDEGRESRSRNLTPWVAKVRSGHPTGGAAAYLEYLTEEVFPLVEGAYRVDPGKRTLVGQSYGGLFGLWIAFTRPDLFESYLLTSASIWFADRALLDVEARYAAGNKDLKARIYLAIGGKERPGGCKGCRVDMVADQAALVKTLRGRNYPGLRIKAEVIDGAYHETTFPIGFTEGMVWLFGKENW